MRSDEELSLETSVQWPIYFANSFASDWKLDYQEKDT